MFAAAGIALVTTESVRTLKDAMAVVAALGPGQRERIVRRGDHPIHLHLRTRWNGSDAHGRVRRKRNSDAFPARGATDKAPIHTAPAPYENGSRHRCHAAPAMPSGGPCTIPKGRKKLGNWVVGCACSSPASHHDRFTRSGPWALVIAIASSARNSCPARQQWAAGHCARGHCRQGCFASECPGLDRPTVQFRPAGSSDASKYVIVRPRINSARWHCGLVADRPVVRTPSRPRQMDTLPSQRTFSTTSTCWWL